MYTSLILIIVYLFLIFLIFLNLPTKKIEIGFVLAIVIYDIVIETIVFCLNSKIILVDNEELNKNLGPRNKLLAFYLN